MARFCRHCGDPYNGKSCPNCSRHDPNTNNSSSRGYDYTHEKTRENRIAHYPFCEACVCRKGVLGASPSEQLHHIVKIRENWNKRRDPSNHLMLCGECHRELEDDPDLAREIKAWSDEHYQKVVAHSAHPPPYPSSA